MLQLNKINDYAKWLITEAVLEDGHNLYFVYIKIKFISMYLCSQILNIPCKLQMAPLRTKHTLVMTIPTNDNVASAYDNSHCSSLIYDEPVEVYILGQNIKAVYCSSSRLRACKLCDQLLLYIV